jgi:flavin reductase (DIM6/NTAB) family NADH-FMN oxidoreductase RutF
MLAVHGLGSGQHELAALFGTQTGDTVDKFTRCAWRPGPGGLPILADCPRWFAGEIATRIPLGNHTGFLLDPVEAGGGPHPAPLMFSAVRDLDAGHPAA